MAVQVNGTEQVTAAIGHELASSRPRLYVIDFTAPAFPGTAQRVPASVLSRRQAIRRRRMARRMRQAGAAAGWAAGSALLLAMVFVGLAGLLH